MLPPRVDKLEFLVLLDNNIERLARLPPGFTHETAQHIASGHCPKDELTGLPLTRFQDFCCGAHGLSILITTTIGDRQFRVLFDAGPEHLSIDRNVTSMGARLDNLDALVLSHWHLDHSGGILRALELRAAQLSTRGISAPPLTVDVHPDRPIRRGLAPGPKFLTITNWPPDPSFAEIAARDGRVDARDEAHTLLAADGAATGVGVSGEIPRVHRFERGLKGAVTWMAGGNDDGTDGGWCTDEQIRDERYLAIDVKGKGLVLFSACSHAGICNVVTDAVKRFARPVHMVVGGLHLVPVETQPVDETVAFLATGVQPRPDWVVPLHCTGFTPRAKLIEAFGDKCVCVGTGVKVVVDGDEEGDAALDEVDVKIL